MSPAGSHRSSRSQSHRERKKSRGSSKSIKPPQSSISNQARVSATNSHHELACGESSRKDSHALSTASDANSIPVYSNPSFTVSNEESKSRYSSNHEYAAQVISGISGLGIDVSPSLQQAIADRYGIMTSREHLYSTVGGEMDASTAFQYLDLGSTAQQDQRSSTVADKDGYLSGDLAGIGAQFDG